MKTAMRHSLSVNRPLNQSGLSIIELLIVLTIAGFILSIVLLAIPALTRNSHNNTRKQDVTAVLEAVSHYELNNSGDFPTGPSDANLFISKLYFYDKSNVTITVSSSGSAGTTEPPNLNADTVDMYNHQVCDPATAGGSTGAGAGFDDVVALYAIETSGGFAGACQQL